MSAQIIAVAAKKGGANKTTIAVNLAHGLALLGYKVALADCDTQGQCSLALGMQDKGRGMRNLLMHMVDGEPMPLPVSSGRDNLYVVTGSQNPTQGAMNYIAPHSDARAELYALATCDQDFDFVIFDTHPSGTLQDAAVAIADTVVMPVVLEPFGMDSKAATLAMIKALFKGRELPRIIAVPSLYDARRVEHRRNLAELRTCSCVEVAEPIPARAFVPAATGNGQTVWEVKHEEQPVVAAAYSSLIDMILENK